jgi:hypothetical protein
MRNLAVLTCVVGLGLAAAAQTNLSLPEGTAIKMKLERTLTTFTNKAGDSFSGRVSEPVVQDGKTVIPLGATIQGHVTKVTEPRRIAGKPTLAMVPETIILPNGDRYHLKATIVDTSLRDGTDVDEEGRVKGPGHDKKDLMEVGLGTGGGMVVGGLAGGGKGVLVGGAIGATATVTHWLSRHRSAMIPAGTEIVMELNRPVTMNAASGGK